MKKITFLLILLFTAVNLYSQSGGWQWSNPKPQGGTVQNMKMIDANNWYLLCDYGVMVKTTNAGASWTAFSIGYQSSLYPGAGIYTNLLSAWFFDANNFILGCQSARGIVRSSNGGITFDTVQIGTSTGSIYDFHFINAQTGYFCATSTFKIQKTTNGGLNWSPVPFTATSTLYSIHAPDTNNIIVTSTSGNTYFTTNAGVNWTTSNVGTTNTLYDSKWINATTGYLCGSSGCFRYTTNGGANWQGTNPPTTSTMNRVLVSGSTIYVGGFDQANIYSTTDNGTTWNTIPYTASGQYSTFNIYSMDIVGSTILVGGTYGLMNKSTNAGANWVTASTHSTVANMVDVYASSGSGRVIAIGSNTGGTDAIVYSTNGGITWDKGFGAVPDQVLSDLNMRNSSTGYVVGRFGIFWKTTNGGVTWDTTKSHNPTLTPFFCNGVDFVDDNTGWITGGVAGVGGNTKIWKTTDGGVNWTEQPQNYSGPVGVRIEFLDANTGYTCGVNQIQKTTNGGVNWTYVTNGINTSSTYNGLSVVDANTVFASNSSAQIFGTTDGGTNWVNLNFPLTGIGTLFCTDWINANTGMVAGIFGTVGKTLNRGTSWEITQTGGYTTMGIDMVHTDTAFAVCGNTFGGEIYKYVKTLTGTITWSNEVPSEYMLSQNYPNPFNPSTKIKFTLPKDGIVTLKVFDVTGQEVKTLINSLGFRSGTITYDFDGSELSSGIYFYSLFVDNNRIDTKKMVLVK